MTRNEEKHILPLLKLALPLIITGLVQAGVFFFQTMFLAQKDPIVLAAGALVSWLSATFGVILFGTLGAISILVSHKYGAKDFDGIASVVRDGLWLSFLLAIPTFIFFWNCSSLFLYLGQSAQISELAKIYLHALAWGLLPNFVTIALLEVIIGLGHTKVILKFSILTVCLSIFFSYALIFGRFGLPDLGIAGAGYGVTIGNWITLLVLVIYLRLYKQYHLYFSQLFVPSKKSYYWELIKIGTPMGLMFCIEVGFFFVLTLLMGALGKDDLLAANQITMQFMGTLMAVIFSIAQAVTIRMGHLLGAGKINAANKAAIVGILLSCSLMLAVSGVFWFKPEALIAIDFDLTNPNNNKIIGYAISLFAVSALFQIVESVRISLFGALRALKDTHFTLLISICSFWLIALPLGYGMAYYFNLAGKGFWWGMVVGASFSVVVLFFRLRYKIKHFSFKEKGDLLF